jgi:hypothetical membrane protein
MSNKNLKVFGVCGIVSALLYIAAWVVGDYLRPGYSTRKQAVSELIETGAPNKLLLDIMILGFHILVIPFAYGLHISIDQGKGKLAPILLSSAGGVGIVLTLFFPCDPGCDPVTFRGKMHIALAIPLGFLIMFSILAYSRRLEKDQNWLAFASYSRLTFLASFFSGVLSAAFAKSSLGGILERLVGLAYQQWYIVMGTALILREKAVERHMRQI